MNKLKKHNNTKPNCSF